MRSIILFELVDFWCGRMFRNMSGKNSVIGRRNWKVGFILEIPQAGINGALCNKMRENELATIPEGTGGPISFGFFISK